MDSTDDSSSSVSASGDPSALLKDMLNVGKPDDSGEIGRKPPPSPNHSYHDVMKSLASSITKQTIHLQGNDEVNSFSVFARDVEIIPSFTSSCATSGSNKVRISPIVNFDWEHRYYPGNLVAAHRRGDFLAYVLKGRTGGCIRLVNRRTAKRSLLKGYSGRVTDLAFAHLDTLVLAATDERGNLFVHEITEDENEEILATLLLQVNHSDSGTPSDYHRIVWCPYIPDSSDEGEDDPSENVSKLLVLTHEEKAEMWNIDMVTREYGAGPHSNEDIDTGLLQVDSHTKPIVAAAFSPDGTALATASLDGEVKFFQVYMQDKATPRCLHQWKPHDGKPLSCMFFLDDHKHPNPELQFWKYAITGACHNTELKVWSCESWTCLQTVRVSTLGDSTAEPMLQARVDLSARYLILTDIKRQVIYALHIHQDIQGSTAHVSSVSEFVLAAPCISIAVIDAGTKVFRKPENEDDDDVNTEVFNSVEEDLVPDLRPQADAAEENSTEVCIRLYAVKLKTLEYQLIRFKPISSVPQSIPPSIESGSRDESIAFRDGLSDISMSQSVDVSQPLIDIDDRLDTSHPVLMTPEEFTASTASSPSQNPATPDSIHLSNTSSASFTQVSALNDDLLSSTRSDQVDDDITPVQTLRLSTDTGNLLEPSTLPLPPVTPNEETKLTSSLHSTSTDTIDDMFNTRAKLRSSESSSSTSQEVSDILARTAGPTVDTEGTDDDNDDEEEAVGGAEGEEVVEERDEEEEEEESPKTREKEAEGVVKENSVYDYSWPKPPNVDKHRIVPPDTSAVDEVNIAYSAEESGGAGDEEQPSSSDTVDAKAVPLSDVVHLQESLVQLTQLLYAQREEIQELKQAVLRPPSVPSNALERLQDQLRHLESSLGAKVESSIKQQSRSDSQRLQQVLTSRQAKDSQATERLLNEMRQSINSGLNDRLESTVRAEMRSTILPTISNLIEPIKQQLHKDLAQKLTATDSVVKENIGKLIKSKQTIEAIGTSAGSAVMGTVTSSYRESMQSIVVPSFEKAVQEMFSQINNTFQEGTKEYMKQLDSQVQSWHRRQKDYRDPVIGQVQSFVQEFSSSIGKLQQTVRDDVQAELDRQFSGFSHRLKDSLTSDIRSLVKEEVSAALKSHHATISDSIVQAVRSGAATPAPDPQQLQAQVLQLLQQGQYNAAFQQALSASDLNLVIFACESVDPSHVFGQSPCPLQQPVLLSLIQQLAANLENYTELKHKYLEEAVMNLDPSHSITQEHMPTVLRTLAQKLNEYIHTHPATRMTRPMRMLLMASQSLLK